MTAIRSVLLLSGLLLLSTAFGQKPGETAKWQLRLDKVDATTYDLVAEAEILDGWYVYSQFLAEDEGPIPTKFSFTGGTKILSRKEGGNKHEAFDPIFEMDLVKFSKKAVFTTRISVPAGAKQVQGSYLYMTCDEEKCLPPVDQKFTLPLPQ